MSDKQPMTDPSVGLGQIGDFTPQQWDELTVGRARILAADAIRLMSVVPRGKSQAFDATRMFARLLFTKADDLYLEGVGLLSQAYHDGDDDAIDALFDLANLEMRRQQRLGRADVPISIEEVLVKGM